jgi:hypothetical protein
MFRSVADAEIPEYYRLSVHLYAAKINNIFIIS